MGTPEFSFSKELGGGAQDIIFAISNIWYTHDAVQPSSLSGSDLRIMSSLLLSFSF